MWYKNSKFQFFNNFSGIDDNDNKLENTDLYYKFKK